MFTSDIKNNTTKKCLRISQIYFCLSLFCVIFTIIYEQFSFGEHSDFMRLMFLFPLVGGALPFAITAAINTGKEMSRAAYNLWNSGIAVMISGCLIKGIIEISGRSTDADTGYWIIGGIFLAAGIVPQIIRLRALQNPADATTKTVSTTYTSTGGRTASFRSNAQRKLSETRCSSRIKPHTSA